MRVLVTCSGTDDGGDPYVSVRERHLTPLREAGLVPVLVSDPGEVAELAEGCVAASLPGTDYVPERLGETDPAAGAARAGLPWDHRKVTADLAVLELCWERRIPVLGVCGGMQAMVVLAGGALRTAPGHTALADAGALDLAPGSLAAAVLGERTPVNSYHRQVVADVGATLVVGGVAADGVVEAVEAPRDAHPFWLGVQWHPELLRDPRPYGALARAGTRWRS